MENLIQKVVSWFQIVYASMLYVRCKKFDASDSIKMVVLMLLLNIYLFSVYLLLSVLRPNLVMFSITCIFLNLCTDGAFPLSMMVLQMIAKVLYWHQESPGILICWNI